MIGQAIRAKNVNQNAKKKRPPKSSKNKMFVFGLHSTSDDRPSNPSKNINRNAKKQKRPLSHRKIKCLFLDYVQLLISAKRSKQKMSTEMQKNKNGPLSHESKMFIFGLRSTSDDWPSNSSKKRRPKHKKMKKAP